MCIDRWCEFGGDEAVDALSMHEIGADQSGESERAFARPFGTFQTQPRRNRMREDRRSALAERPAPIGSTQLYQRANECILIPQLVITGLDPLLSGLIWREGASHALTAKKRHCHPGPRALLSGLNFIFLGATFDVH